LKNCLEIEKDVTLHYLHAKLILHDVQQKRK
jgi:hypothetical protein